MDPIFSQTPAINRTGTAEAYDQYVMKNYARQSLNLVRGLGCKVWDDEGREYLDFTSGIAVSALGHCHPRWVEAIHRQSSEINHVSNLFRHPKQALLAGRLVEKAGPGRVFFCNSGAEANEALIKLARLHGQRLSGAEGVRYKVVCATNAFHGRTFGGMSATPQEKIQKGFRPLVPGFAFGEINDLPSFERLVDDQTAAVFVETIQGEGGVRPCSPGFLQGLRRLCSERGALLMLDEVQCGVGRTGAFFAYEHAGVQPDAVGMAKGLGGGFPIGAIWVSEPFADLFTPGSHGTTFGGTPLACACGLAVLDAIESEDLLASVSRNGAAWIAELRQVAAESSGKLLEVRGLGYMVGLQMAADPAPTVAALRERGLLAVAAGGNVIRFLPPLVASANELADSVRILRAALASA
jgi:acetylornithine/N-succinyldiaminopimelate aminotransferase